MKRNKMVIIWWLVSVVFIFTSKVYPTQTTAQNSSPFNEYIKSEGVDLFTGNVNYSFPLYLLKGRNGANLDIKLNYSSNVHIAARSKNDRNPTGWCGLGWNFQYGAITCVNYGTKTHADDDFYWIAPDGYSKKILNKNGKYFIEDNPYWKLEPQVGADGVYQGWIITKTNGDGAFLS